MVLKNKSANDLVDIRDPFVGGIALYIACISVYILIVTLHYSKALLWVVLS